MRLSFFGSERFVLALAGFALAAPALADGGVASGGRDAGKDASGGTAGTSGTGGISGSGGASGHAGSGGSSTGLSDASADGSNRDASEPSDSGAGRPLTGTTAVSCGKVVPLPTSDAAADAAALAPCTDICPLGSCVSAAVLPNQGSQFAACQNSNDRCLPSFLIETGLSVRFKTCHSVANAEGRCLPKCLPLVAGQVFPVPRDTCLDTELCIPCYNPIDGTPNGVCTYACDPGPTEQPVTFPGCCNGAGVCLDATILPASDRARLQTESCAANELCAPKNPSVPFACEVLGAEPAPPGTGGVTGGGTGGAKAQKDAGTGGSAPPANDGGGCGCRIATREHDASVLGLVAAPSTSAR